MKITLQELQAKFAHLEDNLVPKLAKKMEPLAGAVEAEAKKNCTLGMSPYDWMDFPSKGGASGAPYSVDKNPKRELVHMRDEMYSGVAVEGNKVEGIVGNPKSYALAVHDGTSVMRKRPFILDAIIAKRDDTWNGIAEAIAENAREQCV